MVQLMSVCKNNNFCCNVGFKMKYKLLCIPTVAAQNIHVCCRLESMSFVVYHNNLEYWDR